MAQDRNAKSQGFAVVHEPVARAHTPERSGAHLGGRGLIAVLHDAIPGSNVVQQEVAERVNGLVAESRRNVELPPIDWSTHRGGHDGTGVTRSAPYRVEQPGAGDNVRIRVGEGFCAGAARRGVRGPHELGEVVDIVPRVLRIGHGIERCDRPAQRRVLRGIETIRDAHLIEVGIARERKQARMLALPPEASCSRSVAGLEHWHTGERTSLGQRLTALYAGQRLIGDAFDEAVAQRVERRPESSNLLSARYTLLDRRVNGAVVDERTAGRLDEGAVGGHVPGPQLGDLTDCACDRVLVALDARLCVVNGSDTVRYFLALLERRLCLVELDLTDKPVGQIVEAGRGFGCGNNRLTLDHALDRQEECRPEQHHDQNLQPFHLTFLLLQEAGCLKTVVYVLSLKKRPELPSLARLWGGLTWSRIRVSTPCFPYQNRSGWCGSAGEGPSDPQNCLSRTQYQDRSSTS